MQQCSVLQLPNGTKLPELLLLVVIRLVVVVVVVLNSKPCDKCLALVQEALTSLVNRAVSTEEITAACVFWEPTSLLPGLPAPKGPTPNMGCLAPTGFGFYEEEDYE